MPVTMPLPAPEPGGFTSYTDLVRIRTDRPVRFIDVTELVAERVRRSEVDAGIVNVQTLHTTMAVLVNENEPLLIEDFEDLLARFAPRDAAWRHDDHEHRTDLEPEGERPNGHAHARAVVLGPSACLNIQEGRLQLGRWQRIFLVELDGGRERKISIVVMGMMRTAL